MIVCLLFKILDKNCEQFIQLCCDECSPSTHKHMNTYTHTFYRHTERVNRVLKSGTSTLAFNLFIQSQWISIDEKFLSIIFLLVHKTHRTPIYMCVCGRKSMHGHFGEHIKRTPRHKGTIARRGFTCIEYNIWHVANVYFNVLFRGGLNELERRSICR